MPAPPDQQRDRDVVAWVDATAGVAGDMLAGALVDVGVDLAVLQAAVDAVIPRTVRLHARRVRRAGIGATKVDVDLLAEDQPHRSWATIRRLLREAELPQRTRDSALRTFARLAEAEAGVHAVAAEDVEFHEVGAWDSIADVVAVCAGLDALGVDELVASAIALGSGTVRAAHGQLAVPGPAVLALARGWDVFAGGDGELATPTGVALVVTLATGPTALPGMTVTGAGFGAGSRDRDSRANVVRLVLGTRDRATDPDGLEHRDLRVLEANVDDLDPRVWPTVLEALLRAGAADAWLTPIVMKKGRVAHTLSVLSDPSRSASLRDLVLDLTTTLGVREASVGRWALDRGWVDVDVDGERIAVKVASRRGKILHATAEFDDVLAAGERLARPVREVGERAAAAAVARGLARGAPLPADVRDAR